MKDGMEPCPHCGRDVMMITSSSEGRMIVCTYCNLKVKDSVNPKTVSEQDMKDRWNKRRTRRWNTNGTQPDQCDGSEQL